MINRSTTHRELRTIAGGIAAGVGCPYLALRFGVPDPEVPPPPRTPRLPAAAMIEVLE
jgi:hypothetical protein